MKCPNRNCIEGDIPEITSDTEHLPLICPECQKRFCPSRKCGHRELNEDNYCKECGNYFPEHADEEHDDRSCKDKKTASSGTEELQDFMKAFLR